MSSSHIQNSKYMKTSSNCVTFLSARKPGTAFFNQSHHVEGRACTRSSEKLSLTANCHVCFNPLSFSDCHNGRRQRKSNEFLTWTKWQHLDRLVKVIVKSEAPNLILVITIYTYLFSTDNSYNPVENFESVRHCLSTYLAPSRQPLPIYPQNCFFSLSEFLWYNLNAQLFLFSFFNSAKWRCVSLTAERWTRRTGTGTTMPPPSAPTPTASACLEGEPGTVD